MNYLFILIRISAFILVSNYIVNAKDIEEVIIHTDKSFYMSGEMIWLKTYLRNNENNTNNLSVIVYVELLNSDKHVLTRLKLKSTQGSASGNIQLPKELPTGNYFICAYTLYMKSLKQEIIDNELTILNLNKFSQYQFSAKENFGKEEGNQPGLNTHSLKCSFNKKSYKPKEKITLNISLSDDKGRPIRGNFSISVTKNFNLQRSLSLSKVVEREYYNSETTLKELYIYPKNKNSLNAVDFNQPNTANSIKEISVNASLKNSLQEIINRYQFIADLEKSFSLNPQSYPDTRTNLPFDKTFFPKDYASIATLEDFMNEIIPEIQIKKKKEKKLVRLWNTENKRKVFLYKKEPLLLVDGFVQTANSAFLSIGPEQINRIDISWREKTLNLSSLPKLADCGIISVHTKNNLGETLSGHSFNINEGFSKVSAFSSPQYLSNELQKDKIPDFRNPLYWESEVKVDGKTRLSFFSSDEYGVFSIEIIGITEDGSILHVKEKIEVEK